MNSTHAKILLKLMEFLESFNEIPSVSCSFMDSGGRERLHCTATLTFEIDASTPMKKEV